VAVNIESVYIWRGGLRHWETCGDGLIATPDGAFLGPRPKADRLRLVDADIYSGATMLRLARALRAAGYRAISFAGSPAHGTSLPDCVEPLPILPPRAPLIAVCGLPGSGKSALAHGLASAVGGRYLKWARFVSAPGQYGEAAAQREAEDPFIFARAARSEIARLDDAPVVLDGIKSAEALTYLAFTTRRPAILLWVDVDEDIRQRTLRWRSDPDDSQDAQRSALFAARWEALRKSAVVVRLDRADHADAREALAWHGLSIPLPAGNSLLDKRAAVRIAMHNARKLGPPGAPDFPPELVKHTSYSDKYALSGLTAQRVNTVASAFRLLDDLIDEHHERRYRRADGSAEVVPALWLTQSPWMAVYWASIMLAWAGRVCQDEGYAEMIARVEAATLIELNAELEGRALTAEEYQASLDKEIAFREWIASLAGLSARQLREDAIRAQVKNDRLSSGLERQRLGENV
jgi:hypothetical protein